jgi:hypothetical protein
VRRALRSLARDGSGRDSLTRCGLHATPENPHLCAARRCAALKSYTPAPNALTSGMWGACLRHARASACRISAIRLLQLQAFAYDHDAHAWSPWAVALRKGAVIAPAPRRTHRSIRMEHAMPSNSAPARARARRSRTRRAGRVRGGAHAPAATSPRRRDGARRSRAGIPLGQGSLPVGLQPWKMGTQTLGNRY